MFVAEGTRLPVGLPTAQAKLVNLSRGPLAQASQQSYDETITGLLLVGPPCPGPGLSRQVTVSFLDLVTHPGQVVLGIRWHAAGPDGRLVPALDANLVLTADGPDTTVLCMEGIYRPSGALGAPLDEQVLNRVTAAAIRGFVYRVADAIANPPDPLSPGTQPASPAPRRPREP